VRILVVTNDFPPRPGGIQQYVHNLVSRLDAHEITVFASSAPGMGDYDRRQPFAVIRDPSRMLLPTPAVLRTVTGHVRRLQPDLVLLGAAFPLGLLARRLTTSTGVACAGFTHGVEVAMARVPLVRLLMTHVAADLRLLTAVSDWSRQHVVRVARDQCPVELLVPGVAADEYTPTLDGSAVRDKYGLGDDPVCVCVSRLVPRKGQDRLIQAWPQVAAAVPGARLLLVGGGPYERKLRRLAAASPVSDRIHLTGPVAWSQLGEHYAAGDVFAMPCRTRWAGLDLEALGIVFLEAAAAGLPVVAGRSGGAPETVVPGSTGLVVDGRDASAVGGAVAELLADPGRARAMGTSGRARVEAEFTWDAAARKLDALLTEVAL
jgi:phosphatidylinositol alpha-1,6-mannosyltransferase